ncbi:MAG: hydrogenase 3 maturation endopeptidase HyCI [Candidatus Omnitrophota bacterium]|jgi:hydrogenase 3 maturation protease
MANLKKALKARLEGAERIALLGIGSEFRGDDASGVIVAAELEKSFKKIKRLPTFKVFIGATAPENLTGEIKKFEPTHLMIVDTVEMKEKPGTILLLDPEEVGGGVSFSTHKLPAKILVEYFFKSFKSKILILGIQPKSVEFGKPPVAAVKGAIKDVVKAVRSAVKELQK